MCYLKGLGGLGLVLYSDNGFGVLENYFMLLMVVNCNFVFIDYFEEGGCFVVVLGSYCFGR